MKLVSTYACTHTHAYTTHIIWSPGPDISLCPAAMSPQLSESLAMQVMTQMYASEQWLVVGGIDLADGQCNLDESLCTQ